MAFSILSIVPPISVGAGFGKIRTWLSWQEARRPVSHASVAPAAGSSAGKRRIRRRDAHAQEMAAAGTECRRWEEDRAAVDFILRFGSKFNGIDNMFSGEYHSRSWSCQRADRSIYREQMRSISAATRGYHLVIIIRMGMDIMDATNSMSEVGNIINKECQLVVYKYVIND